MSSLLLILLSLAPTPDAALPLFLTDEDARLNQSGRRLMFLDQPFNGVVWSPAAAGRNGRLTIYRQGLRDGLALRWFPDGRLAAVRRYAEDRKTGAHRGWWPDGTLRFSYHFENGRTHGSQKTYYADGRPATAYFYDHGRETGGQKAWSMTGALIANYVVRDGRRYGLIGAKPCYTNTAVTGNTPEGKMP